jgi:hypothetical protein
MACHGLLTHGSNRYSVKKFTRKKEAGRQIPRYFEVQGELPALKVFFFPAD